MCQNVHAHVKSNSYTLSHTHRCTHVHIPVVISVSLFEVVSEFGSSSVSFLKERNCLCLHVYEYVGVCVCRIMDMNVSIMHISMSTLEHT